MCLLLICISNFDLYVYLCGLHSNRNLYVYLYCCYSHVYILCPLLVFRVLCSLSCLLRICTCILVPLVCTSYVYFYFYSHVPPHVYFSGVLVPYLHCCFFIFLHIGFTFIVTCIWLLIICCVVWTCIVFLLILAYSSLLVSSCNKYPLGISTLLEISPLLE